MPDEEKINFNYRKIKIKQEKLSPPPPPKIQEKSDDIINEIIPKLFGTPPRKDTITNDNGDNEEKKSIEPVKSSNEILAELFKVFNAAPPETLLNDEYLLQKKKKHKKDKKHKKKSKKRGSSKSSSDEDDEAAKSGSGETDDGDKLQKKKKKKKKSSKRSHNSSEDERRRYVKKKVDLGEKISRAKSADVKEGKLDESDFVISDEEDFSKTKQCDSNTLRHKIKVEKDADEYNENRHSHSHHHRHHFYDGKEHQKQQNSPLEKFEKEASQPRKIVIKSVKDSKIFKEAAEKKNETISRHSSKKRYHGHDNSSDRHENHEKESILSRNKHESKRESSEISLSDEETYLREKEMSFYRDSESHYGDRKNSSTKHHSSYYYDRSSRNHYRDSSRERKRNHYHRSRWRSRSRSRSRSYYRGRSRSRSTELVIDKKRLLEIARKNAISMFKSGSLPGTQEMTQEIKDKVLMRMRYGGKSVEELTEFCKKLSQGENLNDLSDLSSNEDSDHDKFGNEKAFHHPFVLKDRGPIVMNIKNATPVPPKTAEQTKAILMQFPVSSGQQHRLTENEWVPVSSKRIEPPPPPSMQPLQTKPQPPKNIFEKPLPKNEKQQPAFLPATNPTTTNCVNTTVDVSVTIMTTSTTTTAATTTTISNVQPIVSVAADNTQIVPLISITASTSTTTIPIVSPVTTVPPLPSDVAILKAAESIFPKQNQIIDVSTVIAKRLNAMRKLQENPTDPEALKMMYDAQKNMSAWANSKYTPGQFTGTTGANILSAKELSSGYQAWAKKDTLTSTTPVSGGMGMHLLQKMGWRPGEGLGKTKNGQLQPLLLDVKMDKRGLIATEEDPTIQLKRKKQNTVQQVQKTMEQKHPVSLLDEISAKRKWGPPVYDIVSDDGPSHRKSFIFQVIVNGVMYQPTIPCRTKKEAKALAAKYCLQQLGVLTC